MSLIDDITARAAAVPIKDDGSLTLTPGDFNLEFIDDFFAQVIGGNRLTLRQAVKKTDGPSLIISGQTDFLGYTNLSADLVFAAAGGQATISLDGLFDRGESVRLPVISWIRVGNIGLTTTFSQPYRTVAFRFHADIELAGDDKARIPIEICKLSGDSWQIDALEGPGPGLTGEQLAELLGGSALTACLPRALVDILEGFSLRGISTVFDTGRKCVDFFSLGVAVTNGWNIGANIALEPGLHLVLTLVNPGDEYNRQINGVVKGTIKIDGVEVPVFVQDSMAGDSNTWMFGLDPESSGVTLPGLSGLFKYAGGNDFVEALPAGLGTLPGINISRLEADFGLSPARLELVALAASTASPWTVIENFLTIENLSLELDLTDPGDKANRKIGARLAGTFSFTDEVWIYFKVQKDPAGSDWVLNGGLPTGKVLNLTDLAGRLLSGLVILPDHIPVISFDAVNVSVIPGKTMSFTAGSHSSWPLVAGKLEIDSFTLNFTYTRAAGRGGFTGSLETELEIAGIPIHIKTSLDQGGSGGWHFKGSTPPGRAIQVGELIKDLGDKFGISVPKPVESFDLQDIRLEFDAGGSEARETPDRFSLGCTGRFDIAGTEIEAGVDIGIIRQAARFDKAVTGFLAIQTAAGATEEFKLTFSDNDEDHRISISWSATPGHQLTVEDLARAFGFHDLPQLPPALKNMGLSDVGFTYDFTLQALVMALTISQSGSARFGRSIFVASGLEGDKRLFALGLDVHLGIVLADIPLVGSKLPDAQNLGIDDAGIWIISQNAARAQVEKINALIDSERYPVLPDADIAAGILFHALLRLGGDNSRPINLNIEAGPQSSSQLPADTPESDNAPAPAGDNTKWFNVQKQIGIFHFDRLGVSYRNESLFFALDAGMTAGPLTFSLQGLSMGSPLTHFAPRYNLDGLGLSFIKDPLEIRGALLRLPDTQLDPATRFQFDGMLAVRFREYVLAALASYAQQKSGDPSLFVFAELDAPLGGIPAFYITGLMGGFGFNRSLELPGQDEVLNFPLLALNRPPEPGGEKGRDPLQVVKILEGLSPIKPGGPQKAWLHPQPGQYWLAVGLRATSFELLDTRALLVLEPAADDFQMAVLGLSSLRLPKTADRQHSYVYLELQLRAVLQPLDGFFGLSAVLGDDSFLIYPDVHLAGGCAFYAWFGSNPNAGQFVLTLGGYHPAFKPPAFYPSEMRLGFNWAVSDLVTIKGGAYLALTPSCVMAGGGLEVLFQDGGLRAWFTAQADMIMSWHPFFFLAEIGVNVGVSYRLNVPACHKTVSASLGASLELWGPPTGGRVHINLTVVSFTIKFGAGREGQQDSALDWTGFKKLLPPGGKICTINASSGLIGTQPGTCGEDRAWVVRAGEFSFFTQSSIPASHLQYGADPGLNRETGSAGFSAESGCIAIRPMNMDAVISVHQLAIFKGGDTANPVDIEGWTLQPRCQNLPESLWGAPPRPFSQIPAQAQALVTPQLVGYTVQAPPPSAGDSPGPVPLEQLGEEYLPEPGQSPLDRNEQVSPDYAASFSEVTVGKIERIMEVRGARDALYNTLADAGIYRGSNGPLSGMAAQAAHIFSDSPLQQS